MRVQEQIHRRHINTAIPLAALAQRRRAFTSR
jgi:hypothetical protein